jgi:hypothetical protein
MNSKTVRLKVFRSNSRIGVAVYGQKGIPFDTGISAKSDSEDDISCAVDSALQSLMAFAEATGMKWRVTNINWESFERTVQLTLGNK